MTKRFPIAAYAATLSKAERASFISMGMLYRDPLRAIDAFEHKRAQA